MSYFFLFIKINFHGINNSNRRSFLWLKSNQKGITSLFGFCFLEYDFITVRVLLLFNYKIIYNQLRCLN